jgi:hypothetical protein
LFIGKQFRGLKFRGGKSGTDTQPKDFEMSDCKIKFKTVSLAETARQQLIPQLKNEYKIEECTKCNKYHLRRKESDVNG